MSIEAIRDVGETLVNLLQSRIGEESDGNIDTIIVMASNTIVALYLYSIIENPDLKNEPRLQGNHTRSHRSPLSLDLYYMLTVYPLVTENIEEQHINNLEAHRTLSRAMRVFYDNGILEGGALLGDLPETGQGLRITLNPITVEDLTRIWSVFPESSYRPSVCYLVTPVRVDSINDTAVGQRVIEKRQVQFSIARR